MISNCGHDENGRYSGGAAGDQGGEWVVREWYSRPWTVVLRHPDQEVRSLLAELATEAAQNDKIGYDQGDRYTYWRQLNVNKYRPRNISTPCEADCSSGVAANVKAVGHLLNRSELKNVSTYLYTGNLRKALVAAGFKALTEAKYCGSEDYLYEGDILLCEGHHVCTNLTNGKRAGEYETEISVGSDGLLALADINLRYGPGTTYKKSGIIKAGTRVFPSGKIFHDGDPWLRIGSDYCSAKYFEGWIQEQNGRWWYLMTGYTYPVSSVDLIGSNEYVFDHEGWMVSADRIASDGSVIY